MGERTAVEQIAAAAVHVNRRRAYLSGWIHQQHDAVAKGDVSCEVERLLQMLDGLVQIENGDVLPVPEQVRLHVVVQQTGLVAQMTAVVEELLQVDQLMHAERVLLLQHLLVQFVVVIAGYGVIVERVEFVFGSNVTKAPAGRRPTG